MHRPCMLSYESFGLKCLDNGDMQCRHLFHFSTSECIMLMMYARLAAVFPLSHPRERPGLNLDSLKDDIIRA